MNTSDSTPECGSISQWLADVKGRGDVRAQEMIVQRYWMRLADLSRKKLWSSQRRVFDEEDVVVKTLNSFFRAAEDGKCPNLIDRDDLWSYLVCIAERNAIDFLRSEMRARRGGGKVLNEQSAFGAGPANPARGLDELAGPSPEMAEEFTGCCYDFLNLLDDDERSVATLKGRGYTNKEIAAATRQVERSVERKLQRIRQKLSELFA
jgi:RNA polymerase sigma factor (sigma-70 family)